MYFKLSERAYNQYKRFVKGNSDIAQEMAEKKLNRNIILGRRIFKNGYFSVYAYGFLLIATKKDEIVSIYNNSPKYIKKDFYKYAKLNQEMEIEVNTND